VKRYEGLFILNTAGKEEAVKETIDKLSAEINAAGGRVETVQKMDKRAFARVANKKHSSGFYVNVIFSSPPATLPQLQSRFALSEDVFRVLFTEAQAAKPEAKAI
jgi:ribosomal protein S6